MAILEVLVGKCGFYCTVLIRKEFFPSYFHITLSVELHQDRCIQSPQFCIRDDVAPLKLNLQNHQFVTPLKDQCQVSADHTVI